MTEKRFTLSQKGTFHTVRDNVENKPLGVFEFKDDEFPVYACFHRIIDLMNNLSKENEQLKKDCTVLIYHNQEYRKENEQLKSTINTLTCANTKMKKVLNTTKKENEHIKQIIKEAYHNERTHIGKNTLKQLIEAIQ